jgi:hypothetical protein
MTLFSTGFVHRAYSPLKMTFAVGHCDLSTLQLSQNMAPGGVYSSVTFLDLWSVSCE